MDFSTQEWLTVLIVVLIVGIFLDGFRRMRNARHDSLKMSLKLKNKASNDDEDIIDNYGSEFPNGGARTSEKEIDKDRIAEVRSKFDFGSDMSRLTRGLNQAIDKIADRGDRVAPVIEPTIGDDVLIKDRSALDESLADDQPLMNEDKGADHAENAVLHARDGVDHQTEDAEQGLALEEEAYVEPQQVPLNLDGNVPMLMETADDEAVSIANAAEEEDLSIRQVAKHVGKESSLDELSDDESDTLDTHSANKPRYLSKMDKGAHTATDAAAQNSSAQVQSEQKLGEYKVTKHKSSIAEEVLVLHVKAYEDNIFQGADLLQLVLDHGLRYGAMDIFHRHANEEGEGPILFSMANMVMPGVFDLKTFDEFATVGVSFFLTLPVAEGKNMMAFDAMLLTAKNIAAELGGELKDDHRSVMTGQTIEHYRERIRDFSRRQQLEKQLEKTP